MYSIKEIEQAIVDTLKAGVPWLRECGSVADFLAGDLERIAKRTPAAYVSYGGGAYDSLVGALDRTMTFEVLCVAENERGDQAARHGVGTSYGVYDLLDAVRECLTESACGLEIDPLLPVDEEPVAGTETVSIYGIRFQTRCRWGQ